MVVLLELMSGPPHTQCRTRAQTGELKLAYWKDSKTLDAQQYGDIDFVGDVRAIDSFVAPFSCDEIFWVHGPEHLPYHEHDPMFAKIRSVLKPGGVVRLSMPDIQFITTKLFNWEHGWTQEFAWWLYGQHTNQHQIHYSGWWPKYAEEVLTRVGFVEFAIVNSDDWWAEYPDSQRNMNCMARKPL